MPKNDADVHDNEDENGGGGDDDDDDDAIIDYWSDSDINNNIDTGRVTNSITLQKRRMAPFTNFKKTEFEL